MTTNLTVATASGKWELYFARCFATKQTAENGKEILRLAILRRFAGKQTGPKCMTPLMNCICLSRSVVTGKVAPYWKCYFHYAYAPVLAHTHDVVETWVSPTCFLVFCWSDLESQIVFLKRISAMLRNKPLYFSFEGRNDYIFTLYFCRIARECWVEWRGITCGSWSSSAPKVANF